MENLKVYAYCMDVSQYEELDRNYCLAVESEGGLTFKVKNTEQEMKCYLKQNLLQEVEDYKIDESELDRVNIYGMFKVKGKMKRTYMKIDSSKPILIELPEKEEGFAVDVGVYILGGVSKKVDDDKLINMFSMYFAKNKIYNPVLVATVEYSALSLTKFARSRSWLTHE